jgi:molybdopterin/thiamine biosynthesis adenylyltransferase
VESAAALELLAGSDWILLATDNHARRFLVQKIALQHFVPMISAGVNITVNDGTIEDVSGEVITVRAGDGFCLNCLGRLDYSSIAHAAHPDPEIRRQLVARGYVTGAEVKEPAVKTLNTMLATLAVDTLVEQFAGNRSHVPILVYENNQRKALYSDTQSLENAVGCMFCGG